MKIKNIQAREIIDSRGNPTVETTVTLEDGSGGVFGVPSGASTGIHEAHELRDGDPKRYLGKGVLKACENVNAKIASALKGVDATDQAKVDGVMIKLDGDPQKKNLGANAIVSVSVACAKAVAISKGVVLYEYLRELFNHYFELKRYKLPLPMFNVINGGAHADNALDVQEFMIGPIGAEDTSTAVRMGAEVFHYLQKTLKTRGLSTNVGNEGGFAPDVKNEEVFALLREAIEAAGYVYGRDVGVGIDVAASEFYRDGKYMIDGNSLDSNDMVELLKKWVKKHDLISVEDGLAEDDISGWRRLNSELGDKIVVVGDDFLVTNKERVRKAIDNNACNSVLIKVNQVGSLTETLETVALAYKNGLSAFVSHRSGETTDTFIADLAVAVAAAYIKSGAPSRGERVAKYNRLTRIYEQSINASQKSDSINL